MKAKYILVSLLLVALVMGGTGYGVSAGSGSKVTGGGTFYHNAYPTTYATPGDKISFGFNAQSQGSGAKGQFHLTNHNSGMKVSGTISQCMVMGSLIFLSGSCSVDGVPTSFWVDLNDGGEGGVSYDLIMGVWFGSKTGKPAIFGQLDKGNIQSHK